MKKKGFTLIELLAVIIIIAIIALIVTPTILGVIEKARRGAVKASALGYIDAIEKQITIGMLNINDNAINDGTYNINDLNISFKGKGPIQGEVIIENLEVKSARLCMDKYSINYNEEEINFVENNYCSTDFEITLDINGTKESKKIGTNKETTFEISDMSNMTNVSCNNGAVPTIEENTLKIANIFGDTKCVINETLEKTINNLDSTETNIVILSDEIITNRIIIKENNKVNLDLNGKKISTTDNVLINNYGILNLSSSKESGQMIGPSSVIYTSGKYNKGILNIYSGSYINTASTNDGRATFVAYEEGIINVYGDNATFDENGNYLTGTYLKGDGNSAINIASYGGTLNMYSGTVEMVGSQTAIRSNVNTDNTLINIYGGQVKGKNNAIGFDNNCPATATINIYDGLFEAENIVVYNLSQGTINIFGGKFVSLNNFAIFNSGTGIININQTDKIIYVTSLAQTWKPAIYNVSTGTIDIKGKLANKCTNDSVETTSGLCVYAEGDKNYESNTSNTAVSNAGDGNLNIDGGTYFGGYMGVSNHYNGIVNILNGSINSGKHAIDNMRTGIINICNANISTPQYDIWSASSATGIINYSSNVVFTNGTNSPVIGGTTDNIIPNYTGTCITN